MSHKRSVFSGNNVTTVNIEEIDPTKMFGFNGLNHGYYKVGRNEKGFVVSLAKIRLTGTEAHQLALDEEETLSKMRAQFL